VGSTKSYNAIEHEAWLMKYNKNGDLVWMLPESWNILSGDDVFTDVFITDSAQYALAGYTTTFGNGGRDAAFYLMAEHNQFKCSHTDGSIGDEEASQVIQTSDKAFSLIGTTNQMGIGLTNVYCIKMGFNCSYNPTTEQVLSVAESNTNNENVAFGINPNISDGRYYLTIPDNYYQGNINILVTDLVGKIILTEKANPLNASHHMIDISGESSGLYFITVITNDHFLSRKVIKWSN
jgi:hypothetical protein